MQISIRAVNFVITHTLRASIEAQLASELAWTDHQTWRLRVFLPCNTGPRGEVLKCCKIQLHLSDGRNLIIEDSKSDFHLAVERTAKRIDREVRHARRRRIIRAAKPLGLAI